MCKQFSTFTIPDPASVEEYGRTFNAYREGSELPYLYHFLSVPGVYCVSNLRPTEYYLPNDGVSSPTTSITFCNVEMC